MNNITCINQTETKFLKLKAVQDAVERVLVGEGIATSSIQVILLSDADITDMNVRYLEHNYPTDVISFAYETEPLEGDVYIGLEVARSQAEEYKVSLTNELERLAIHGTLHIIGYDDQAPEDKEQMTILENKYLKV